ncbi:hypothetical protein PENVUL_c039G09237 [Penicillium vulpinum]|uniref:Uncharacterized protein n=2 Tax=Penicillium vulpinum TaxID=29845 RepID=A0A1V6RMF9_9EURO|nr:hypothetical protein PENVUL_c039G09237 [Penicillium vulpinum]
MIGQQAEEECNCCQQGEGPFSYCVVIDTLGWPKECANCHWDGNDHQCSHAIELAEPPLVPLAIPRRSALSVHDQDLARQRASDRQDFLRELNTLRDITAVLCFAARNNEYETTRGLRFPISSSPVPRVWTQVGAGACRGNAIHSTEQLTQRTQDLQRALDDLIRRYRE